MSEPVLRQWELLRAIPRHPRKRTAKELQEWLEEAGFEASLRSVQRDLNDLATLFPLTADDRERPFGWSWTGDAVFDLPGMDTATALSFELTGQFLEELWPQGAFRDLAPYQKRAREVLQHVDREGLKSWTDKVRLLPRGLKLHPPEIRANVLEAVYRALLEERRFEADYCPRGTTESRTYEVNPLGLVVRDGILYLVATLWRYSNPVHLAVHRLERVNLLEATTWWPEDFDLDTHIAEGGFRYPRSEATIQLRALFSHAAAWHLAETPLSEDQALTETEDGVEVLATVQDTEELKWWLQGFGDAVMVLGPEELVDEFREMAVRLANAYGAFNKPQ